MERHLSAGTLLSQLFFAEVRRIQFYFSLTLISTQERVLMDNYGYYGGRPASDYLMMKKKPLSPWTQKSHMMSAIGDRMNEILEGVMKKSQTRFYLMWFSYLLQRVIAPNSLDCIFSFVESICSDVACEVNASTVLWTVHHFVCSLTGFPERYQTLQRVVHLLLSYVIHLASQGSTSAPFCFGVSVLTISFLKVPGDVFQAEWISDIIALEALVASPREYGQVLCLLQLCTEYCSDYVFT